MSDTINETPESLLSKPKIVGNPEREYVAVNTGYSSGLTKLLSTTIDDIEVELDLETYDRMGNDSTIAKAKKIIVTNVLVDDLEMAPGATEDEVSAEEFEKYEFVMGLCERMLKGLDRPFRDSLEQILGNGFSYGHGIAEVVWEYRKDKPKIAPVKKDEKKPKLTLSQRWGFASVKEEEKKPSRPMFESEQLRLMPKAVKVKPRGALKFVVDDYMNILGLLPTSRGLRSKNPIKFNQILDREKFFILTLNKRDEDPRGNSFCRPAFNWYNIKSQVPAELLRFILEESVPKAVGTLGPSAAPFEYERDANNAIVHDAEGNPKMLTAAESFARQILGFRAGGGAVIPNGATLEPFKKGYNTDANVFPTIIKTIDDQIENAILLQTLAQSEGSHQARSASQQVAELLYNLVFWIKWSIGVATVTDILRVGVKNNLGEWALAYMPKVSLGDFTRRDWPEELKAYADAYFKGLLDDTQRPEIMANLNLPKPGPSRAELGADAAAVADVNGEAVPNPNKRPDKQTGNKDRNKGNGTPKKSSTGFGSRVKTWFSI